MNNRQIGDILNNVETVIVGKRDRAELILTSLLASGHVLLEDVPGVGKTQLAASIAYSCGGTFNRIQMTPDIMPGDITGFSFLDPVTKELSFRKGAAFCNFLLADEINRSSPKSQSALLEIMEEVQVSMDGNTYDLPRPFMVLATQNPVETFGTFHLPEAQMDRFLMKITIGYPTTEEELKILERGSDAIPKNLKNVTDLESIAAMQKESEGVLISKSIREYIVALADASREMEGTRLGISPRGTLAMTRAAKAYAYIQGRDYTLPDDIKYLAQPVWAHRILLTPQGKSKWTDGTGLIKELLETVKVPV